MKNLQLHITDMLTDWLHDYGNKADHQDKLNFAQELIDEVNQSNKEAYEERNSR